MIIFFFSEMTEEMECIKKLGPAAYTLSHLMVDDKFQKKLHWHTYILYKISDCYFMSISQSLINIHNR